MTVRPAAVAGLFYAGHPDRLRAEVSQLLARARAPGNRMPKALIVPHAGYVYSGGVAAEGFATLQAGAGIIERVVVIGPAHYVPVQGMALPRADAFATPLGRVAVDRDSLSTIGDMPAVTHSDAPHAPEHALEVELPFLQMLLLPSFMLVPLLVGAAEPYDVAAVLGRLWGGPETVIVVSSDLSHFHDYDTARRMDADTAAAIERGDWSRIGPDRACGFLAVAGLLMETERRGLGAQRLSLYNSGDTAGPRDRVVGYGAWAFAPAAP